MRRGRGKKKGREKEREGGGEGKSVERRKGGEGEVERKKGREGGGRGQGTWGYVKEGNGSTDQRYSISLVCSISYAVYLQISSKEEKVGRLFRDPFELPVR